MQVGRSGDAERLREDLLRRQRALAEAGDDRAEINVIQLMREQALTLLRNGKAEEALPLAREVLDRRLARPDMGPNDPDTYVAMDVLASVLREIGGDKKLAEAERLLVEACEGMTTIFGPDHFTTIARRSNLAMLYFHRARGRTEQERDEARADLDAAVKIMTDVTTIERRIRGVDHRRTLLALNNLAAIQYARADLEPHGSQRAQLLAQPAASFEEVLVAKQRVVGDRHRDTLDTMSNLAVVLREQAIASDPSNRPLLERAYELHRKAIELAPEALGPQHWLTGWYQYKYAESLWKGAGDREAALEAVRDALDILIASRGEEDARTRRARDLLEELETDPTAASTSR